MQKKWKSKWIKALTGGGYRQTRQKLIDRSKARPSYCCLGVLARVQGAKFNKHGYAVLGDYINEASGGLYAPLSCGLTDSQMSELVSMNDGEKKSFKQIAAWIKKNVKGE